MWLVIKLKKGLIFNLFKCGLKNLLLSDPELYSPKITRQRIKGNKFYQKDLHVLGNYIFVFHETISMLLNQCTTSISVKE